MGHERVGTLPRTTRWRTIVAKLYGASVAQDVLARVAASTLQNVRSRLRRIEDDPGVQAAFHFLLALPAAATGQEGEDTPVVTILEDNPSPLRLVVELKEWVDTHAASLEYATIAKQAATDAIADWTKAHRHQSSLFTGEPLMRDIWAKASRGAGFSEVARLFFASFTERYLNYFLEREASSALPTVIDRERFAGELRTHIELVSNHAFETSKITQSFAAGWYNRYARQGIPSRIQIKAFLGLAFAKICEELLREARN